MVISINVIEILLVVGLWSEPGDCVEDQLETGGTEVTAGTGNPQVRDSQTRGVDYVPDGPDKEGSGSEKV